MVITTKKLIKAVIETDGNQTQAAKKLGIRTQSLHKRIQKNPHIKQAILNVREEALKKAGLSRSIIYKRVREGLDAKLVTVVDGKLVRLNAPDFKERREHAKIGLQLHKDLDPDKEQSGTNIAAVIFAILHNPKREGIEVV